MGPALAVPRCVLGVLTVLVLLADAEEQNPASLEPPPLVQLEPAPSPPHVTLGGTSNGAARFGGALLGTLIATGISVVAGAIAFPIGWLLSKGGPTNQNLGGALGFGAIIGGVCLVGLVPLLATVMHEGAGGRGREGDAYLGFALGAVAATALVVAGFIVLREQPAIATALFVAASPMPFMGTVFGLEAKHRASVGFALLPGGAAGSLAWAF
jgi:hypothetical protein